MDFYSTFEKPITATQEPISVGGSVLALEFDGGVAIAADTLVNYGKMARHKGVTRLLKVNKRTLIGVSGDYADYQELKAIIECKEEELECRDPGATLSPVALHSWLTAVLYNRRSKMDPLWTQFVVGGIYGDEKKPFVGTVNKLGVAFTNPFIATGFGLYLCNSGLEDLYVSKKKQGIPLTKDEAITLLGQMMEVLFYRDGLAYNEFEVGVVTSDGVEILPVQRIKGNWKEAVTIRGYD